jgi:hypothetical protein
MKGKNVGKKHFNRRTKKAKQPRPKIHDLDGASSSDSDPHENDKIMQGFLLPVTPPLLPALSDDVMAPLHLQINTSPQTQYVIKQCE